MPLSLIILWSQFLLGSQRFIAEEKLCNNGQNNLFSPRICRRVLEHCWHVCTYFPCPGLAVLLTQWCDSSMLLPDVHWLKAPKCIASCTSLCHPPRAQAIAIGQALVDGRWLDCVTHHDQIFRDEYALYRPLQVSCENWKSVVHLFEYFLLMYLLQSLSKVYLLFRAQSFQRLHLRTVTV